MLPYPYEWAGDRAPAPVAASERVLGMARRAQARTLATGGQLPPPTRSAAQWRLAGSIAVLGDEANAANPNRDKSSDGTIGDARHVAEGSDSDHNPWVVVAGVGVVRARDIDVDGLDLPAAVERARQLAAAGQLPQLTGGGYIILNHRITAPDFSGWHAYTGADPHVTHAHFSVSREPGQFDDRRPWGIFTPAAPAPVPPQPAPPVGNWTGPDLTGVGPALRGQAGGQPQGPQSNGPRVRELQHRMNVLYPLYSHLDEDGWYGPATAGVMAEFGRRSGIACDGLNIGPKLALALYKANVRP